MTAAAPFALTVTVLSSELDALFAAMSDCFL